MENLFWFSSFNGDISNWNVEKLEVMSAMFSSSQFTGDISNWKAYKVYDIYLSFEDTKCTIPYWSNYDEFERKKAIDTYHLNTVLSAELKSNNNQEKRIKI